jgi:hypothetical protein
MEKKYFKCILKDCSNLCFNTLIDLVVKHYTSWYDCYVDVMVDYYYIQGSLYVVISSDVENSRELAEILLQEGQEFCPASGTFPEQDLDGQKIAVTRPLFGGSAEISYTELGGNTIYFPTTYKIYYENNGYTIHELDEREF